MTTVTLVDPSTVESVTVWWKPRRRHERAPDHCDQWWYSIDRDDYRSENEPFPADLLDDADTINDAVVLIAARVGVVIDPSDVVDWYPDKAARWQREGG